jgi:hypothetical protein
MESSENHTKNIIETRENGSRSLQVVARIKANRMVKGGVENPESVKEHTEPLVALAMGLSERIL